MFCKNGTVSWKAAEDISRTEKSESQKTRESTGPKRQKSVESDSRKREMNSLPTEQPEAKKKNSSHGSIGTNLAAGSWVRELIESISKKSLVEMKPPNMKSSKVYEGSDVSKFRSWRRSY